MNFIRTSVLIGLFSVIVYAQASTTLRGRVTNKNGTVAGAVVTLVSTSDNQKTFTARTSKDGNYRLSRFPAGMYYVRATLSSGTYAEVSESQTVNIPADAAIEINLSLDIIQAFRETVTVAAGGTQTIDEVSKTVDVINSQEMRDRADFSLVESLRTIPGFRVQQSGGFGRVATVKTRGLRNQDTAVLLDGIRFRDASAISGDASPFLSDFTLTSVNKIEVLRGSGSSLYGTNAIGGAIDFKTPSTRSGTHGQVGGALGGLGLGRFRGNISHGTESGKFGINIGLSRTVYSKGIDGDDDAHNTNVQTRFDANPFARMTISGRFFFSDADVRTNANPDTLGTLPTATESVIDAVPGVNFTADANDPDSFQTSRFYNGQFVLTHAINSNLVFSGHYSGVKTARKNTNGPLGPGFQSALQTYLFDGQIHTLNGHFNWSPKNNLATFGYEFEAEKFGNDGRFATTGNNFSTEAIQSSNTFYAQDLLSLMAGKLQFSGAFRAQWFSLRKPTFSSVNFPNRFNNIASPQASYTADGSVSYFFERSRTKLRAHVGNGYRVPSLYERFGSYFFANMFFGLGNPELKPERSIAIDGGIEQSLATDRVRLSATYFYTKINDEISYLPTDDLGAAAYYNFDKHFSRGLEFSSRMRPSDSTEIFASYTFTNSDIRNFRRQSLLPSTVLSTDRKVYGVPDHQFTLVATQRFGRLWVNFDFLATSSYLAPIFSNTAFNTYIYRFEGNRKGDLTAGYTFGFKRERMTLRLFGTIENIFDHEYYENGFRTPGRSGRVGLTFGF